MWLWLMMVLINCTLFFCSLGFCRLLQMVGLWVWDIGSWPTSPPSLECPWCTLVLLHSMQVSLPFQSLSLHKIHVSTDPSPGLTTRMPHTPSGCAIIALIFSEQAGWSELSKWVLLELPKSSSAVSLWEGQDSITWVRHAEIGVVEISHRVISFLFWRFYFSSGYVLHCLYVNGVEHVRSC